MILHTCTCRFVKKKGLVYSTVYKKKKTSEKKLVVSTKTYAVSKLSLQKTTILSTNKTSMVSIQAGPGFVSFGGGGGACIHDTGMHQQAAMCVMCYVGKVCVMLCYTV